MKVLILTEGGKNLGFGHITRCTALYQAFEEREIIPKFIVNGDDSVIGLLVDKNYEIFDWLQDKERLFEIIKNVDIVVIDSYLADFDTYKKISDLVKITVFVDDNKRLDYPNGIVVNGSIYAEEMDYSEKEGVTYLLGTKYMPLRKEFWEVPEKEIKKEIENIMITFGGDDMRNMTPKVLKLIKNRSPEVNKYVVVGKGYNEKNIKEIKSLKDENTFLLYNLSAKEMKEVMVKCDLAISGGGQTLYELARVGLPTIAIAVADNQMDNIEGWEKAGFIEYAGWWEQPSIIKILESAMEAVSNKQVRKKRCKIGQHFMDGLVNNKIIEFIIKRLI